ncbi:STAS domain-containing protein [Kibdelosporangium phytohabitans]|uniref:STAS domain-containing protein n=1 Tax=Kibdelosporangium phytohabitans TaxID=860235 RepID=A0A0N9HPB4_9PSEU|nr:STAS domain-containing protein [Kibdelosporangium phytohabitans]ALG06286.1 hypothetical protein AOZ06_04495 [Kibdelosporangium phytohabitans]MBE1467393.1 anti-anti-sigma factor [Kibdelosporangium phytohabitans]
MIHHRMSFRPGRPTVTVTSETRGEDTVVLRVIGEVTVESAPVVDLEVRRVCRSSPTVPVLLVDLTDVTFFGAAALTMLLDAHRRTQLAGAALSLVAPPRIVRLLGITGLAQVFSVHDTVRHAIAAASERSVGDPGHHHLMVSVFMPVSSGPCCPVSFGPTDRRSTSFGPTSSFVDTPTMG